MNNTLFGMIVQSTLGRSLESLVDAMVDDFIKSEQVAGFDIDRRGRVWLVMGDGSRVRKRRFMSRRRAKRWAVRLIYQATAS